MMGWLVRYPYLVGNKTIVGNKAMLPGGRTLPPGTTNGTFFALMEKHLEVFRLGFIISSLWNRGCSCLIRIYPTDIYFLIWASEIIKTTWVLRRDIFWKADSQHRNPFQRANSFWEYFLDRKMGSHHAILQEALLRQDCVGPSAWLLWKRDHFHSLGRFVSSQNISKWWEWESYYNSSGWHETTKWFWKNIAKDQSWILVNCGCF